MLLVLFLKDIFEEILETLQEMKFQIIISRKKIKQKRKTKI